MIALFHRGDARADLHHDACALVPEDRRKQPLRIGAGAGELVGVADAGRFQFDHHFAGLRAIELHRRHFERLPGRNRHRCTHVHA